MLHHKFQTFTLAQILFLFVASITVLAAGAKAEDGEAQCQEATSLWIPSQTNRGLPVVTKWEGSIGYTILSADQNHTASITNVLKTLSQEAHLGIDPASGFGINLFIVVPPDITAFGTPASKNAVDDFFMDFYRQQGLSANVPNNSPAIWEQNFRDVKPKCLGASFAIPGGRIERAFLAVQANETPACIEVGLGEVFGLVNIRTYFLTHDLDVPPDLFSLALRTLYSAKIEAGMSRSEVVGQIGELCKGLK